MPGQGKRKKLGQHFLADPAIAQRIAQACGAGPGDLLVEIGPGKGALTGPLLDTGARVIALELDEELFKYLGRIFTGKENLSIVRANALKYDYTNLPAPFRVASNLPYSVAAPIIKTLIANKKVITSMTLMTQKEVAQRLCAAAGDDGYGSLSVFVGYHCQAEYLFDVPPRAFRPWPKVDSAVLRLTPWPSPPVMVAEEDGFFRLVQAAFAHRRKTIKNNLAVLWPDQESFLSSLEAASVTPSMRAEEITMGQFASLYEGLIKAQAGR